MKNSELNPKCPKCESRKVQSNKDLNLGVALILCLFIVTIPLGIIMFIVGIFTSKDSWNCRNCHANFKTNQDINS